MADKNNSGKGIPKVRLDYTDIDFLIEVEGFARDGYDDQQIAEIFNVSSNTFSRNKIKKSQITKDNPKGESLLSRALKKGRKPLSVYVENSLLKRASGMTVKKHTTTSKYLVLPDGTQTETKIIQTISEEIELPPDTTAAIFWLKNHKPNVYNCQPIRFDATTSGKDLNDALPKIIKIEHVMISDKEIEKFDIESSMD